MYALIGTQHDLYSELLYISNFMAGNEEWELRAFLANLCIIFKVLTTQVLGLFQLSGKTYRVVLKIDTVRTLNLLEILTHSKPLRAINAS